LYDYFQNYSCKGNKNYFPIECKVSHFSSLRTLNVKTVEKTFFLIARQEENGILGSKKMTFLLFIKKRFITLPHL
jgi:hypothetical protein